MYRRSLLVGLFLCLAAPLEGEAQRVSLDSANVSDTAVRHVVQLNDGSRLVGRITAITSDSVRLRLGQGEVNFARAGITEVRQFPASRMRNGQYWFENPHPTRLLFSSTAFPLERGTGYYSNTWLALHTFAAGVTDRFTLGGGLAWFPGVPVEDALYYVLPKYTVVNGSRFRVALGALLGALPFGGDDATSAGLLYGVGTTGSRDSNFSFGLGWGYQGGEVTTDAVAMLGGQTRLTRRISFISENWIFPSDGETEAVYSYGLRFLGEGLTVDLAFVSLIGESTAIPWVGFAFRF